LVVVLVVAHIEDIHQVLQEVTVVLVEVLVVTTIMLEHFTEVQVRRDKDLEEVTQPKHIIREVVEELTLKVRTQLQLRMVVQGDYQPF
jgi:hypothetical protein